jgi:hypothetical protein
LAYYYPWNLAIRLSKQKLEINHPKEKTKKQNKKQKTKRKKETRYKDNSSHSFFNPHLFHVQENFIPPTSNIILNL